jgi:nucleotide-binding universal stress UspA family protein
VPEQKIRRVLVPMDGSENSFRAAAFAADIALKYGSELVLAHALEIRPTLSALGMPSISVREIKRLKIEARKEVDPWFARAIKEASPDLSVRTEIIESAMSLVGTIIDYAEKEGVDLIIMGSRGRTGFKKLILGSVASGVVTYAPCPVMVVK